MDDPIHKRFLGLSRNIEAIWFNIQDIESRMKHAQQSIAILQKEAILAKTNAVAPKQNLKDNGLSSTISGQKPESRRRSRSPSRIVTPSNTIKSHGYGKR